MSDSSNNGEVLPSLGRQWACEQLGVPPNMTPQGAVCHWLYELENTDFVLWGTTHDAVQLLRAEPETMTDLNVLTRPSQESFRRYIQQQRRELVNSFFDLQPQERMERIELLAPYATVDLTLTYWLPRLREFRDFSASLPEYLRADAVSILRNLQALFLASPTTRPGKRAAILAGYGADVDRFQGGAAQLIHTLPRAEQLDPELVQELRTLRKYHNYQSAQTAWANQSIVAAADYGGAGQHNVQNVWANRLETSRAKNAPKSDSQFSYWIYGAIGIVAFLIKVATMTNRHYDAPRYYNSPPSYSGYSSSPQIPSDTAAENQRIIQEALEAMRQKYKTKTDQEATPENPSTTPSPWKPSPPRTKDTN